MGQRGWVDFDLPCTSRLPTSSIFLRRVLRRDSSGRKLFRTVLYGEILRAEFLFRNRNSGLGFAGQLFPASDGWWPAGLLASCIRQKPNTTQRCGSLPSQVSPRRMGEGRCLT